MALRLRDKLKHVPAPTVTGEGGRLGNARPAGLRSAVSERVQLPSDAAPAHDGDDRIAKLRALIGDVVERDRRRQQSGRSTHGPGTGEPIPLPVGALRDTPHGPLHLIERWLEPEHCHGRVPVQGALGADATMLARLALDPALEGLDLSRMLIFDTETTGLAGGAGTVPFLIGLAFFEDGVLKVEQLFLPNFGAEAPMLHHLARRMSEASCLVSYNGKSFDWPLLRSRFVMNRVPVAEPPPHVDLLHCARRVLKSRVGDVESRMESVKLTAVEREVLGFHREDDVDGALIPGLYLGYLRGAEPETMLGVLEHNDNDVVALAAILGHLCERYQRVVDEDDPRDHLAYARVALRAQDLERAEGFAAAAARGGGAARLTAEAHSLSAAVARKRGDPGSAAAARQRALEVAPCEQSEAAAHIALAKLNEHQLKDLLSAHRHARWTLPIEGPEAHGRRLGRLRRRLERSW
jgi:uncharacterized protein YprB with RNaseH-like and TPR domain